MIAVMLLVTHIDGSGGRGGSGDDGLILGPDYMEIEYPRFLPR